MKDFSSAIKCVKKNLTVNKDYEAFLQDIGLDSFESIWRHEGGKTIKKIRPIFL